MSLHEQANKLTQELERCDSDARATRTAMNAGVVERLNKELRVNTDCPEKVKFIKILTWQTPIES